MMLKSSTMNGFLNQTHQNQLSYLTQSKLHGFISSRKLTSPSNLTVSGMIDALLKLKIFQHLYFQFHHQPKINWDQNMPS